MPVLSILKLPGPVRVPTTTSGSPEILDRRAWKAATRDMKEVVPWRRPRIVPRSPLTRRRETIGADERRIPKDLTPVEGSPRAVAAHLRGLAAAGADEAILVANPITEASVRALGAALVLLDA